MRQVKNARLYLIPASVETRGHGTVQMAKFYEDQLRELYQRPRWLTHAGD
jgi:homoserine O-acetyltransferase/O-succinyltransferase